MDSKTSENLTKFIEAINIDAENECKKIKSDAKDGNIRELESLKEELSIESSNKINFELRKIQSESNRDFAALENKMKSELIAKRDAIESSVFDEVEKKIKIFIETDDYKTLLIRSAEKIGKLLSGNNLVIFAGKDDEKYFDEIKSAVGKDCEIKVDETITLGGLKASTDTFSADDTLECRLKNEHEKFKEYSGLSIV